jgi:hypothetical protein
VLGFTPTLGQVRVATNMDFGGNLAFAHTCHNTFFSFSFYLKESEERLTLID